MGAVRLSGITVLFVSSLAISFNAKAQSIADQITSGNILVDAIVNIGKRSWNIVEEGKAVVTEKPLVASALPRGITDASQLNGFKLRYLQTGFEVNQPIGGQVINYDYRVVFTYGGSLNGVGKYIGYATIEKVNLDARWLAPELNVWVSVPTTYNAGTAANPIAAMKLDIHFSMKRLQVTEVVDSYIIFGNGQIRRL